jgi:hypothetical protein
VAAPAASTRPPVSRAGRLPAPHPRMYDRGLKVISAPPWIALVCIPWWPPPRPVSSAWRTGFPSSLRISGCDGLQLGMYSLPLSPSPVPAHQRAERDLPVHSQRAGPGREHRPFGPSPASVAVPPPQHKSPASWQSRPPTMQVVGTRCKAAGLQRVPAHTGHEARPQYARALDASRAGAAPRATG